MKSIKTIALVTFIALHTIDEPSPEVTIEQGRLVGKISDDGSFFEYLGIPYAAVNHSARFQAPLPPKKWQGVYHAIQEGDRCPQKFLTVVTSLDCLNLNVFVPVFPKKPLPVMVFIHGGGFTVGSGGKIIYGPEFIVRKNVILVTINYRLGALGFLCLRTKEVPGNAALKDQVAALRWVKKNIGKFGGDPDNVTIFGESAGGVSVSYMIATNITDGLFQRAIVQSGSSLANWGANREPLWSAKLYAEALGYKPKDYSELNDIFAKVPTGDLIRTVVKKPWTPFYDTQMIHLPCVEIPISGEEAAILDIPHNLIKNTKKNISVIYGSNNKEGTFIMKVENSKDMYRRNEGYLFASDLAFENKLDAQLVASKVKHFYYGDEPITLENVKSVIKLYTDIYFDVPEALEADLILANTNITVFNYNFRYDGFRNVVKYISGFRKESGASHGDELFYLFNPIIWPFLLTKQDWQTIDFMTTMWTNFAKHGNPTPPSSNLPITWEPSTKEGLKFLYIDSELSMGPIPDERSYNMWKDIYSKYLRKNWD